MGQGQVVEGRVKVVQEEEEQEDVVMAEMVSKVMTLLRSLWVDWTSQLLIQSSDLISSNLEW